MFAALAVASGLQASGAVLEADVMYNPFPMLSEPLEIRLHDGTVTTEWPESTSVQIDGYTLAAPNGASIIFDFSKPVKIYESTSRTLQMQNNTEVSVTLPDYMRVSTVNVELFSESKTTTITLVEPESRVFTDVGGGGRSFSAYMSDSPITGSFRFLVTSARKLSRVNMIYDKLEKLPQIECTVQAGEKYVSWTWDSAEPLPEGTLVYFTSYPAASNPTAEEIAAEFAAPDSEVARKLPLTGIYESGTTYLWPKGESLEFTEATLLRVYAEAPDCASSDVADFWSSLATPSQSGIAETPAAVLVPWTLRAVDGTLIASWTAAAEEIPAEIASGLHGLFLLTAPGLPAHKILLP